MVDTHPGLWVPLSIHHFIITFIFHIQLDGVLKIGDPQDTMGFNTEILSLLIG